MAKLAFWITAGPDLESKALAGLRLASRLKTVRQQDVKVYLFGPGVALAASSSEDVAAALESLREAGVPVGACPANVKSMGIDEQLVLNAGVELNPAGEVLIDWVETGYQVIGI
jgi:hypothetical protein